ALRAATYLAQRTPVAAVATLECLEPRAHRRHCGMLQIQIECGLDRETAAQDTGTSEPIEQQPTYLLREVARSRIVVALGRRDQSRWTCDRRVVLLLVEIPLMEHPLEDIAPPIVCSLGIVVGRVVARRLRQAGDERGLRRR